MLRRSRPSPTPSATATLAADASASAPRAPGPLVARLAEAGWVLPRGLEAGEARWTLVGTVDSPTATAVDPSGLVAGDGWSLDWWVGAEDRWHLPAREVAVRQQLVGEAPVVETRVKVPGGDLVHRAYGIRSPRSDGGDEWVIVEIENATPVPVAIGLAVRPLLPDAVGAVREIALEPVGGVRGRDQAHLVRVDGAPAVVLPRQPNRLAVGNQAEGDAATVVTDGRAGEALAAAVCPDALATLAVVYPLPHTAVLRVALPIGVTDPTAAIEYPTVLPDAAAVANGWEVHRRGPRLEVPDRRLAEALSRARTHVLLAQDGTTVRRDGRAAPDLEPGATEVILGALDLLDRPAEVGRVAARWPERVASATPEESALVLEVVAHHWLVHRIDALLDWLLPEVAAAVERIDRADRKGRLTDPTARHRAARSLAATARVLAAADQADAGEQVAALAARLDPGPPAVVAGEGWAADELVALAERVAAGDRTAPAEVAAAIARLGTTGAAPGPGPHGRPIGHDLAASAAVVRLARALLVDDGPDGLALLPAHPEGWYGASLEVHDLPTAWGRLSYAVRWHGPRPAVLWDLEPHDGVGPVTISAPALDRTWTTSEHRGDALLGEVAPPEGVPLVREVPDHPDIDPAMRRPGRAPDALPPALPEGGSFS